MSHIEQDGHSLGIGRVVEIKAEILAFYGFIEDGADSIAGEDLANDILLIGVEMEALGAGCGQKGDRAGEGGTVAHPWFNLWMEGSGTCTWVQVFTDDAVLWVKEASLGQKCIGFFFLSEKASLAGLLHERGDPALMGDREGECVVAVARIEFDGFVELDLGTGKLIACDQARSVKIGILRSLGLVTGRRGRMIAF
jgi:hypothetical protein